MKDLIRSLCEAFGPPGREGEARARVEAALQDRVDTLRTTTLGSLLAVRNPGAPVRVLLTAHLDEPGLIVSHLDERGFGRFQPLGPLEPEHCLGRSVRFSGGLRAVVGAEAAPERTRPLKFEQLFLDFTDGGKPRLGAIGAFEPSFSVQGVRVVAGNLDGRLAVAVLIEVLRRLKKTPHEVQCAFTVQQEVGNRGAGPAAHALDPHLAIALGLARAGDTPGAPRSPLRLGAGPAVVAGQPRLASDPRLVDLLARRANAARLPLQHAVLGDPAGEAAAVQAVRAGVPAVTLALPCRHLHSACESAELDDAERAVRLLLEVLRRPIRLPTGGRSL